METQFEQVTGYKLVGLGPVWSGYVPGLLPLGHSSAGATRSVPSPRRCPSASRSHDAPTIPASDGGGLYTGYHPDPPWGVGGRPEPSPNHEKGTPLPQVSKAPPGVRGVPETPPPGVAEENLESPTLHGAPPGNTVDPSLGGRIPARQFRSPSRTTKADSRPFGRCMKRSEETGWPLR